MNETDRLYERLLVLRAQTGDEVALTELIHLYSPRLRYYLRKMLTGRSEQAEDVLQEIWCDALRSLRSTMWLRFPPGFTASAAIGPGDCFARSGRPVRSTTRTCQPPLPSRSSLPRTPRLCMRPSPSCRRSSGKCSCSASSRDSPT